MKFKLFACEILFREFSHLAATCPNRIDVEFLPKTLHDGGRKRMNHRLCEILDSHDFSGYDAVLLGYGLCSGGLVGLTAHQAPMVISRAHDCIGLFVGSRKTYLDYFSKNPGTFFKSTGWIERGEELRQAGPTEYDYGALVKKFGKDNADYIVECLKPMAAYRRITFLETGLEPDDSFERQARENTDERGWEFDKIHVDLSLFRKLLNGDWDEEFLVVPPGHQIDFDFDGGVMRAVPAKQQP